MKFQILKCFYEIHYSELFLFQNYSYNKYTTFLSCLRQLDIGQSSRFKNGNIFKGTKQQDF